MNSPGNGFESYSWSLLIPVVVGSERTQNRRCGYSLGFESENMQPALTRCIAGEVRLIVLTCSDIFEQLRGSGTVDKIKKYCRDSPSGDFTDLGRRDVPQPTASVNPDGRGR